MGSSLGISRSKGRHQCGSSSLPAPSQFPNCSNRPRACRRRRTACTGAGRRALHPAAGPYPATYHALPASQPFRLGRGSGLIRIPVDLHTPARTRTRCTNHHSASQCTTQRPTLLPGRSSPSTRVYKYRGSSSRPASSKAASSSFLARRSSQCTVVTNADHQQLGNG